MDANVGFSGLAPILFVSDFQKSLGYFVEALGFRKAWDWGTPPGFGCVAREGVEIFLCQGGQGAPGTWLSIFLGDVDGYHREVKGRGARITQPPKDEPWGMREFLVELPDQHVIRFGQGIVQKDLKIRREAMDVRLEERLAAVLKDFAKQTNRTVGEVLEETLLHTLEGFPGEEARGVPSPHTRASFKLIQDLKKKHGLDYDTHANYRFTE